MKPIFPLLSALLVLCVSPFARAQVWDGRVVVDTAAQVAAMTGYPLAVVQQVIPAASINGFVQSTSGITLVGGNLNASSLQLGAAGLASYDVSWKYYMVQAADGSGFILMQDVALTMHLAGQSTPITNTNVIMDQPTVYKKFNNRQYSMQIALYSSQWFYAWLQRDYTSRLWSSNIGMFPGDYFTYYNQLSPVDPHETISMDPIKFIDYVPH